MTSYETIIIIINIGLLIVAIVGLKQLSIGMKKLKQSEDHNNIKNKRETIILTSQLVKRFQSIISDNFEISKKISSSEKGRYEKYSEYIEKHKFPLDKEKLCQNYIQKNNDLLEGFRIWKDSSVVPEVVNFTNTLESFSMYFVTEVADANIAYISVGRAYCSLVEKYMPALCSARCNFCGKCEDKEKYEEFYNTLTLYIKWKSKINFEKNELDLLSKIEENKILRESSKFKNPIGVKK